MMIKTVASMAEGVFALSASVVQASRGDRYERHREQVGMLLPRLARQRRNERETP